LRFFFQICEKQRFQFKATEVDGKRWERKNNVNFRVKGARWRGELEPIGTGMEKNNVIFKKPGAKLPAVPLKNDVISGRITPTFSTKHPLRNFTAKNFQFYPL